ncbi:MAG TPA: delta-60 repeat domain-containing protein [Opitutaceae bacterium]
MLIPVSGARRRCLPILVLAVIGLLSLPLHAQTALDGFDPEITGSVNALAVYSQKAGQYAGKIMAGGSFSQVQPHLLVNYYPASGLVRLNQDGTVDTTFAIPTLYNPGDPDIPKSATSSGHTGLPAQVFKIIALDDGKVIVGGNFEVGLDANAPKYLVRFNADGSVDSSFNPVLTGDVDGVVSGLYMQTTDDTVSDLYVGGDFTEVDQTNSANNALITVGNKTGSIGHAVRFLHGPGGTGLLDPNWNPNCGAQVDTFGIQVSDKQIVLGGAFTTIAGPTNAQTYQYAYLARVSSVDGSVDTTYNPQPNGQVASLALESNDNAIIGGWFTSLTPTLPNQQTPAVAVNAGYVARVLTDGSVDETLGVSAANDVQQVIIQANGTIVLVGDLGLVTSSGGSHVARFYPNGNSDLANLPNFDNTIYAVAEMPNGQLVLGGIFGSANINHTTVLSSGQTADLIVRHSIARLNPDGTLDNDFDPNAFGGFGVLCAYPEGGYLVGGSFTSIGNSTVRNLAHINADGSLDESFAPNPDGPVMAIAIDNSNSSGARIVIGGEFLNPSLTDEYAYANAQVTTANPVPPPPTPIPFLARLSLTGTLDETFQPDPNGPVQAILVTGSQYVVGGQFSLFDLNESTDTTATTAVQFLARVNTDGTIDTKFEPQPSAPVVALLLDSTNNYVIAGGSFTFLTPNNLTSIGESGLARIKLADGSVDGTWNPDSQGAEIGTPAIFALALQPNGEVLFAGQFNGLVPGNAALDPTTQFPIPVDQSYIARALTNGNLDPTFAPTLDGPVYGVAVNPTTNKIYIAGIFQNVDRKYQPYIARLNSDGTIDKQETASPPTGFGITLDAPATALLAAPVASGSSTYQITAVGAFTSATPFGSSTTQPEGHIVRFAGDGTAADGTIDTSFAAKAALSGQINALAISLSGNVYVGGNFTNIGGTFATDAARFWSDSTLDPTYGADINGGSGVNTIVIESNENSVYYGGSFTLAGNKANVSNFVRLNGDGSYDSTFDAPGIDGTVYTANPEASGEMLVGGSFANITDHTIISSNPVSVPRNGLALLYTGSVHSGGVDPNFDAGLNAGAVVRTAIVEPDGHILIGGSFTSVHGTPAWNVARLNSDGSLDSNPFLPVVTGGVVNAMALEPDGSVVIGGTFTSVNGSPQAYLAIVDPSGTLSTAFNPVINGPVNAVLLEDPNIGNVGTPVPTGFVPDTVIFGGSFTAVNGQTRNRVARLTYPVLASTETPESTTPTLDPGFDPNANFTVTTLAFDQDGKIYLGGAFTTVGGIPRNGVARVSATGTATSTITTDKLFDTFIWSLSGEVPEMNSVIFRSSPDGINWNTLGSATRGAGNTWKISGEALDGIPDNGSFFIQALGESQTSEFSSESEFQQTYHFYGIAQSSLVSAATVNWVQGQPYYYELGVTNEVGFVVSVAAGSALPPGITLGDAANAVLSGNPTTPGTYQTTLTLTNSVGPHNETLTFNIASPSSQPTTITGPQAHLINLSSLVEVATATPAYVGFTITDPANNAKDVLLRAVGPALGSLFGLGDVLQQPHATLYNSSNQTLVQAQGWSPSSNMTAVWTAVGAFPLPEGPDTSFETALAPGPYTMIITSGLGDTGTALAEIYDADFDPLYATGRLSNLSTRALAGISAEGAPQFPFQAGFIVDGPPGSTTTLIIRAVGPQLGQVFGIGDALADPQLTLLDGQHYALITNANWQSQTTVGLPAGYSIQTNSATIQTDWESVGAFDLTTGPTAFTPISATIANTNAGTTTDTTTDNGYDAAIEIKVPPGTYTVEIVSASQQAEGESVVEIWEIPNPTPF